METEVRVFRGPAGLGTIRFNKNHIKVVADDGNSYEISHDNLTAEIPSDHKKILNGVYFSLSHDETELRFIRPPDDTHVVEFRGFGRSYEDNELGTYMQKRPAGSNSETGAKWPARPDEERFNATLNIVAGDWKNYSFTYWLPYIFTKQQGSQVCRLYATQSRIDRITDFFVLCGIERDGPALDIEIPWSPDQGGVIEFLEDTLLPLKKKNRFQVTTENGWPLPQKALTGLASGVTVA